MPDCPDGIEESATVNVAMMQPAFLPWQGFFELIYKADRFVFLDDFQFSVQSYHQRNRFFVNPGKVDWYSVPVRKEVSFGAPLNQARISEVVPWRKKMWKRIQQNYGKSLYFSAVAPHIERWLLTPADSLAAQNSGFIRLVCELMGFRREFRLSSEHQCNLQRSERVLDLLRWCEATCYFSARGSFGYMREDGLFPVDGIQILFQDFKPKPYLQLGAQGEFVPFLSILDALLNVGPKATAELVANGTSKWWTWDEIVAAHSLATISKDELRENELWRLS